MLTQARGTPIPYPLLNFSTITSFFHLFSNFLNLLQVRLIKELYGNQIGELYHSLPYDMIEFVLDDFEWSDHFLVSLPFVSL